MLTGDNKPVPKLKGDFVYGGTVNGSGSMKVRTRNVGSDAVLSQTFKQVNYAQTARAPIDAVADRATAILVPAVVEFHTEMCLGRFVAASTGSIPEELYNRNVHCSLRCCFRW